MTDRPTTEAGRRHAANFTTALMSNSNAVDNMTWARAEATANETILAIETEALAALPDASQIERYEGRIEAFDAVLAYVRDINGNGHDEPKEPALDAVWEKVRDLRSRATAARAADHARRRGSPAMTDRPDQQTTLPGLRWWRDGAMVNWSDGGDPDDNGFVADAASDDDAQRLVDEYNCLARERDLAVAHDRQPYPTAWAYEQVCRRLHELEAALALTAPAPSSEGGLDVERVMDAEHRWCVQVEGEWALGHEVEAHRKQAEFILARLRDSP